jgi:(S)-2-hydroxyglutarate dehydrogenase
MESLVAAPSVPTVQPSPETHHACRQYDVAIIGGGIVGLSTGLALIRRYPRTRLLILEKEPDWALHQTGHNSGVIHSGIYYRPGSFKARFARTGNDSMVRFCRDHGIPVDVCGKVIVATEPKELPLLERLYERGQANDLQIRRLSAEGLRDIEPHCHGLAALHVPNTAIVDYRAVARAFVTQLAASGAELRVNSKVEHIAPNGRAVRIETTSDVFDARFTVNCAGLQCDRVARMLQVKTGMRIVPVRGEYYRLKPEKRHLVRHLIYPVPNPQFPFLGVHFTRLINGDIHAGPNAVLTFKREAYDRRRFDRHDSAELLGSTAFWRFAARNWQEGAKELARSLSKSLFARSLQRLIPEVHADDLVDPHAGVRAQALTEDGRLVDDFMFVRGPNSLHVCNAPSPAATASIPIGHTVVDEIEQQMALPASSSGSSDESMKP